METFLLSLAAYIVGWVLCNVFVYKLVQNAKTMEESRKKLAKLIVEEMAPPGPCGACGRITTDRVDGECVDCRH